MEVVLADGFDEYAAEAEALDVGGGEGVVEGREEDEGGASGRGVVAEGADEVEPLPNRLAVERKTAASTDKQASLRCSS